MSELRSGSGAGPLHTVAASLHFQNPVVLAAGTAGYGREVAEVLDLESVGGLVTKAVSMEPRSGAPSPRVAEFSGGMLNAVGLANPGVESVRDEYLPWLEANLTHCMVFVNVVGYEEGDFARVVERLDSAAGFDAFELNLSCPNVKAGGLEFGSDIESLRRVVSSCRAMSQRPISVKLSPVLPDIARMAAMARDAGADMVTLVNTIPGLLIDTAARLPRLGNGSGGVSGSALLPVGVLATARVCRAVPGLPVIGVGGVSSGDSALQYLMAGATLVGVGTAALRDPRVPGRIVRELLRWAEREGVREIAEVRGAVRLK